MDTPHLPTFLVGLASAMEYSRKFKDANNEEYAWRFNPLIAFYNLGENKVTDLLAHFLNPEQTHGQKRLFLDAFFEHFDLKEQVAGYKSVTVTREKATDKGRKIDLLLDFDQGKFGVAIENKIWGPDQPQQLADYSQWMQKTYNGRYILIYLTPYGKLPGDNSITIAEWERLVGAQQAKIANYGTDIISLLDVWQERCKADKVRHFLKDFKQYVHHKVNQNIFMEDQNTIVAYALANEQNITAALSVANNIDAIQNALLRKLKTQLEEVAQRQGVTLGHFNLHKADRYRGFSFLYPTELGKNYFVQFQWQDKGIMYGNWGFAGIKQKDEVLYREFTELFGASGPDAPTDAWLWCTPWKAYRYLSDPANVQCLDVERYADIANGKFAQAVEKILIDVLAKTTSGTR
jgi:hypothetical protein